MPQTVLLVEDDLFTSRIIKAYFEKRNYIVQQVFDSSAAFMLILKSPPDCIILDINLPTASGIEIVSKLKELHNCPVIFYTSLTKESIELKALKFGGNDFLSKQRGVNILFQRVENLILYSTTKTTKTTISTITEINGFTLNPDINECYFKGETLKLQLQEVQVINYMMKNIDKIVNRDELSFITKGYTYDGWSRSIDLLISRLKRKLASIGVNSKCIRTVRGKGYCLISANIN